MEPRRIKALRMMERLRGLDIERELLELNLLRAQSDLLDAEKSHLAGKLSDESESSTIETGRYIARFRHTLQTEIATLDRRIIEKRPRIEALESRILELYREKRTFEAVREKSMAAARAEADKREESDASELQLMRLVAQKS